MLRGGKRSAFLTLHERSENQPLPGRIGSFAINQSTDASTRSARPSNGRAGWVCDTIARGLVLPRLVPRFYDLTSRSTLSLILLGMTNPLFSTCNWGRPAPYCPATSTMYCVIA